MPCPDVSMWIVTAHSYLSPPQDYVLKPGRTLVGRKADIDIPLHDAAASRLHAALHYDPELDVVTIHDLNSTNGTFVNQERLARLRQLQANDEIAIGQHLLTLTYKNGSTAAAAATTAPISAQALCPNLMTEAVDLYTTLLYDVAVQLNKIIDLDMALHEGARLVKQALGADRCEVILHENFNHLQVLGFPPSLARLAIKKQAAILVADVQTHKTLSKSPFVAEVRSALCVPVMSGEAVVALVYIYRTRPLAPLFNQRDLHLAIAVSHQVALTIQRARLMTRIRKEQNLRHLLQRFLSPHETEMILREYEQNGHLPGLQKGYLTVLVADIQDATGLAERLGPWRFGEILSRYYHVMMEVIFERHALLNKIMGDGLLAVFGMFGQPAPEKRAIEVALTMLERLQRLNQETQSCIEVGIAINTGPVVAGYLGNEDCLEYTVLGQAVNVALALEPYARPNRILIGPQTYRAIAGLFEARPVGALPLKGLPQPLEAYEVLRAPLKV